MKHILTPDEMRACDHYAIKELGIPSILLMENAVRSAMEILQPELERRFPSRVPRVLILCGAGNNGGDGFALARHCSHSSNVRIAWIGTKEKMSDETRINLEAAEKHGIQILHLQANDDIQTLSLQVDCIVDALIGIGGNEYLRGITALLLERIAEERLEGNIFYVALDVPSGLNAATGIAHEYCFRADWTISMAAWKTGLLLNDARDVCGEIHIVPIGIPTQHIAKAAHIDALEETDIRIILPKRHHHSTKHSYGSVAIIGGTSTMAGAPTLAANACISAGAGLVRLYAPSVHAALLPEIMPTRLIATERGGISLTARNELEIAIEKNNVFVIGMGLGAQEESVQLVEWLLDNIPPEKPIVLDADGLRAVRNGRCLRHNIICTPHKGEFARLTQELYDDIATNAHTFALQYASSLGCIMLLKNVPTIITNGTASYWNTTGNAGLASAGSGDVLAGVIGAMLAQGVESLQAAALGAFLHGRAGDILAKQYSEEGITASGLVRVLRNVFP